ncbi:hypothetical protein [Qipengyuania nanhaisediminis]|uniref:hypothetical protein n=1 Tax=Qipengyuania nanhaisediminis TaxID=604088 RepID=UPI0038B2ADEE
MGTAPTAAGLPDGWSELRANPDIQFEPIPPAPAPEPREPSWWEDILEAVFGLLGDLFMPVGRVIGASWPVLQWILLALAVAFALYTLARLALPLTRRGTRARTASKDENEWQPEREESLALLEDADRLADEGRFDEAVHLLLHRSIAQIAAARPDCVEPSSTARELAALRALPAKARAAFAVIAERVERSLFALRALDRNDWIAARAAYSDFALARIDASEGAQEPSGAIVAA